MDIMARALDCASPNNPVLFLGPPGVGKTARIEQWADATGKYLFIEHPVIAQSVDYRGLPAVVDGEAHWLPLGHLKAICEPHGPETVVLFDDVGQASQSVQAALMQLIWARKLGDAKIRGNVSFIMCSNRVTDKSGVRPMVAALVGRCQVINVAFDLTSWSDWAIAQKDVDANAVGYIKFRPDCFVDKVPDDPMAPFCTPRTFTNMGRLVAQGVKSIDLLAGWVGPAIAADFMAYLDTIGKLPMIEDILRQPEQVRRIKDPGLLHAITAQAARKAEQSPADVMRLADVLGGGWGVQLVSASASVWPDLKKTHAFKAWAVNHREII